ncbi:MAG: VWA domain-containing protein [Polaromonas sp.]
MLKLDLNKSAQALRLSLGKAGVNADIKAELIFDIDVSGSFEHEHEEGTTSQLLARLVPYGMVLDPDGKMDVFTFSDGERHVHAVGVVTPSDCEGYIERKIVNRVPGWGGGTTYSYVLERNLRHFGWLPQIEQPTGFLSRFLGRPPATQTPVQKKRSLVLFVTDGENDASDEARTMLVLKESQDRGDQVYFLFMGFCDRNPDFKFIKKIAERYKNTGVVIVRDLEGFVALSDEEINSQLLVPELLDWLRN